MRKDLQRCLGQTVEIIYMDRYGAMSQRKIKLQSKISWLKCQWRTVMLSNRPTALIREALVLSYIQKWLDDKMKYLETVNLGRAIMPFVDHLHTLCLFQIVKVKTKLRKIGVKVVDQKFMKKISGWSIGTQIQKISAFYVLLDSRPFTFLHSFFCFFKSFTSLRYCINALFS